MVPFRHLVELCKLTNGLFYNALQRVNNIYSQLLKYSAGGSQTDDARLIWLKIFNIQGVSFVIIQHFFIFCLTNCIYLPVWKASLFYDFSKTNRAGALLNVVNHFFSV